MANEITLKIGKQSRKVKVPSSWNDLDNRTLLLFHETLFYAPGDEFTVSAFTSVKLIGMTQMLLGIDAAFLVQWEAARVAETPFDSPVDGQTAFLDELRQTMHYALDGLFEIEVTEEGATTYATKLNRTENPYTVLAGPPKTKRQKKLLLYGPASHLDNITIYEMGMAFSYFEAYLKTNKEDYAHNLIALLYRPTRPETKHERESGWGGDRRQKLRGYESKIEERAKLVKTMPALVQRVLVFWFASCRQSIVDAYPKVFKKDGDGGRSGADYGWGGVLLSVAESGPMGALGEVSDQHYSNVLTYLSMKHDEAEEHKRQADEARRKRR
jgi:hypothetical protein